MTFRLEILVLVLSSCAYLSSAAGPDQNGQDHHTGPNSNPRDFLNLLHTKSGPPLSSYKPKTLDVYRNFKKRGFFKRLLGIFGKNEGVFPYRKRSTGFPMFRKKSESVEDIVDSLVEALTPEKLDKKENMHGGIDLKNLGDSLY